MSYTGERFSVTPLLSGALSVTQCGMTDCAPGHATPKQVYGHYSLHFVLRGKGRFHAGGTTYTVEAGQGFLICPDLPCCYTADQQEPWHYLYISFNGSHLHDLLRDIGLSRQPVFSYDPSPGFTDLLYAVYHAAHDAQNQSYEINGYFYLLLARLAGMAGDRAGSFAPPEKYVAKAVSYMEDNFVTATVEEVSQYVGLNRTHLYRLFMRSLGTTPSRYLHEYRLHRAAAMMEHPEFTLTDIALAVGFCDSAHFCHSFQAFFGVSPRVYRCIRKSPDPASPAK